MTRLKFIFSVKCNIYIEFLFEIYFFIRSEVERSENGNTWANITFHGFVDTPVSVESREHGFFHEGDNLHSFVIFPNKDYWLYAAFGYYDLCQWHFQQNDLLFKFSLLHIIIYVDNACDSVYEKICVQRAVSLILDRILDKTINHNAVKQDFFLLVFVMYKMFVCDYMCW